MILVENFLERLAPRATAEGRRSSRADLIMSDDVRGARDVGSRSSATVVGNRQSCSGPVSARTRGPRSTSSGAGASRPLGE